MALDRLDPGQSSPHRLGFALFRSLPMRAAASLVCALFLASPAAAETCKTWSPAEPFGQLDIKLVNEASGLEVSDRFGDRLYHNNDSGDGLLFYVSGLKGDATRAIDVE